jgi:hypothetical protein
MRYQDIRARLHAVHRDIEETETRVAHNMSFLRDRASELSDQISKASVDQTAVVDELRTATHGQSLLHGKLHAERSETWHTAASVMLTFTRGSSSSAESSPAGILEPPIAATDLHRCIALGEAAKREAAALRQRLHDSHARRVQYVAAADEAQSCLAAERMEADALRARLEAATADVDACTCSVTHLREVVAPRLRSEILFEEAAHRSAEDIYATTKRGLQIEVRRYLEELRSHKEESQMYSRRLASWYGCCLRRASSSS